VVQDSLGALVEERAAGVDVHVLALHQGAKP
jgi:hypothetical protein